MNQVVQIKPETASKPSKSKMVKTDNLRVRRETKKKVQIELASLNKKDFGRPVTADDYVALAISLLQPAHLDQLRQGTLSNKDRMEKRYQEYCVAHGKVSKDEFIGVLLAEGGEAAAGR
jgi:hypothetical protein